MNLSRRSCLKTGLALGILPTAGCSVLVSHLAEPGAISPSPVGEEERLLNRCGFGLSASTISEYRTLGKEQYLEKQLRGDAGEEARLTLALQQIDVLQLSVSDLWDLPFDRVLSQLQQAAILYAVYGNNQLRERMVDFWTNHFNIYARKGHVGYAKGGEEFKVIRENALGSFPDMLKAMARSAAMLEYLDQPKNKSGVPNENYARELMELHTLGLHGGYSQRDVQEVARCFTGWTIEDRFLHPKGQFRFDESSHDDGPKTVLGHRIASGGGEQDAETVLEILGSHPSTARFLSEKLCLYFLGSKDEHLIARSAAAYTESGGSIARMLRHVVLSDRLIDSDPIIKRPFDLLVSALRMSGADTDGGIDLQTHLDRMGEPLYQWPMPDGYPTKLSAWTGALLPRWNFAAALCSNQIRGTRVSQTSQALALKIAGPEFQWR